MEKSVVLIVDDEPVNIEVLRGTLSDDYQLKVAINGAIALKVAEIEPIPDLILMDVMMPEMDGYTSCERLKANPLTRSIPVIFVTSRDETEDETRGFKAGAVDYLRKPIVPEIVKSRVRAQLALHSQRKELSRQVRERTVELNETRLEIIRRLGVAGELKDNETGQHVDRVSRYTGLIARKLGLDDETRELMEVIAPMHDIGKIGIPETIINKPGRLDEEERAVIETHPEIGARIIGDKEFKILAYAREVALSHHEKWDGSGYPGGLVGEEIPLIGRIVAITDVFDALSSPRPYKDAWPVEKVWALIEEESGRHFDPKIVRVFIDAADEVDKIRMELSD
jgi:putative two-component system response regulator